MICVGHLKFGCNDRLLNFNYDGTQRINCLQFDFELMTDKMRWLHPMGGHILGFQCIRKQFHPFNPKI